MRALIIGATGYIGANVGKKLNAVGHEVTGFTRTRENIELLAQSGMKSVVGELFSPAFAQALDAADAVVYAPQLLMDPEQEAVDRLLSALAGSGKAFIFTSGTGVLGQRTKGDWSQDSFAEDDSFVPLRAIAKRVETENLVRAAAAARDVRSMVIRPPRVWGHGARGHLSMAYESVGRTGAACYIGKGLNLYSNVHIDDLADLYLRAALEGRAGALYHAVGGEVSNRWIAECVARDLGCETRSVDIDEAIRIWGRHQTLIVLSVCSRSRAIRSRSELGWAPTRLDMLDEIGLDAFRVLAQSDDAPTDNRTGSLITRKY